MIKTKSHVTLSLKDYNNLIELKGKEIERLETENEHLKQVVESDFVIDNSFFLTRYFKKEAGTKFIFDSLQADFDKYKECIQKRVGKWVARFFWLFVIFLFVSVKYIMLLLK